MNNYEIFKEKLHEFKLLPRNYDYKFIQFHACPNCVIVEYETKEEEKSQYQLKDGELTKEQIQEILDLFYTQGNKIHHINIGLGISEEGILVKAEFASPRIEVARR